jgi:O-acetyl-ADP-ribose deacetylase (regulator of RNase III)
MTSMDAPRRIEVVRGDITALDVDAIVNAANERMLGGGGVDGAIHRAAGPELLAACRAVPEVRPGVRCPTGEARITAGFRLPARHVIHTVGPVWHGGGHGEPDLLARCYRNSLALAREHGIQSMAFPAISCGVYGYPLDEAAAIAVREVRAFQGEHGTPKKVLVVAFDEATHSALHAALATNRGGAEPRMT